MLWSHPEIILNIFFLPSFLPSYEVQVTYDTILVSGIILLMQLINHL